MAASQIWSLTGEVAGGIVVAGDERAPSCAGYGRAAKPGGVGPDELGVLPAGTPPSLQVLLVQS